jgi:hydrogenase maturation protein HypF
MKTRVRAKIIGRVQGVGFRPTVYRYATQLGLGGYVRNDTQGVTLEVEGDDIIVGTFFNQLTNDPPRQAVIADIKTEVIQTKGDRSFEVVPSEPGGDATAHVSPDLAMCDDCLREISDPQNRRYGYAFTNCTNCGPRFTIMRAVPYDRDKTSMSPFTMCEHCEHEYHHPPDRRFHAQPNACSDCGPRLQLNVSGGTATADSPLAKAQQFLRRGCVVAIKGLGGYQLACDATSAECVARLRERKRRPHKALAVMFCDLVTLRRFCDITEAEEAELLSVARPIVIVRRKSNGAKLAVNVSPDTNTVGAFLPNTPLHHLLLRDFDALVMTSGNASDEPIISDESELGVLETIAEATLTHDRPIVHKCDDSVVRVVNSQRQFMRCARGFAPNPLRIAPASGTPQILAVGGESKNTFCLVRGGLAFVSQHIGDLKDYRTHEFFTGEIAVWQQLMHVEPGVVAYDLHPAYLSTKFAEKFGDVVKVGVQHHHAHIASVMTEHDLHEPMIGVALDGTGYGTDGTIWGGEFFVADRCDFERVAHFKSYPMPGGDKAIEEPWRMAASVMLTENLCQVTPKLLPIKKMIDTGFNSPPTSSAGRLFDAVAAMLGLCDVTTYEGQAAVRLESIADPLLRDCYPFEFQTREQPWIVDFGKTIREIRDDRRYGVTTSEISAKFHNTIVAAIVQICRFLRGQRGLGGVALSGGVFQNELLLRRTVEALQSRHFKVFTNSAVPPNDGGLALGQAAVAMERIKRRCV